jgi:RNA polymerase sigma factor for flagellar operon FliA
MELAGQKIKEDDRFDRAQLIKDHLSEVKRIVKRIALRLPAHVEIDDLMNAGIIGLIEAVESYDPSRDNKFMTYASHRIRGEVLSELRAQDIHSRSDRMKIRVLENAYVRLEHRFGREANDEEIAEEIGITIDELYQLKETSSISLISLEEIGLNSTYEKEKLLNFLAHDDEPDPLTLIRLKELEEVLAKATEQLSEKEKMVLSLYYREELTMEEIGMILGITESRVSQIHSHALFRLRLKLKREKLIE